MPWYVVFTGEGLIHALETLFLQVSMTKSEGFLTLYSGLAPNLVCDVVLVCDFSTVGILSACSGWFCSCMGQLLLRL